MNLYGYEFQRDSDLAHYGVLGMRWGIRKDPQKAYERANKKYSRLKRKGIALAKKASKKELKAFAGKRDWDSYSKKMAKVQKLKRKAVRIDRKANKWLEAMSREFKNIPISNFPSGTALNPDKVDPVLASKLIYEIEKQNP